MRLKLGAGDPLICSQRTRATRAVYSCRAGRIQQPSTRPTCEPRQLLQPLFLPAVSEPAKGLGGNENFNALLLTLDCVEQD